MRYVVAMLFAIAGAALAFLFVSGPVSNWAVLQFKFESPDEVEALNQAVFMGVNLAGLLVGWVIGWVLGAPFKPKPSEF